MWGWESVCCVFSRYIMHVLECWGITQTVLDTVEVMERGWEYWEAENLSAELTHPNHLQTVFFCDAVTFQKTIQVEMNMRWDLSSYGSGDVNVAWQSVGKNLTDFHLKLYNWQKFCFVVLTYASHKTQHPCVFLKYIKVSKTPTCHKYLGHIA